ncbi:MAG: hypothetical protein ACUZ8H_03895 [Candidatus Anammoxibacter sp.]
MLQDRTWTNREAAATKIFESVKGQLINKKIEAKVMEKTKTKL